MTKNLGESDSPPLSRLNYFCGKLRRRIIAGDKFTEVPSLRNVFAEVKDASTS